MPTVKLLASRHTYLLALLAACVVTILVYLPGLFGPFVFDDYVNIVQNPGTILPNLSLHALADAAFSMSAGLLMRPVSMLSFALERYFFGSAAFSFKAINLGIHLINGALIFLLLHLLLQAYRQLYAADVTARSMQWLAIVTGTLWLVHPLNLTAVLYVVQRETSLSALFMLAGISLYTWARLRQINGSGTHWTLFPGTVLFGALSVLSKESGALMPCYILAVELFLFQFRFPDNRSRWIVYAYFTLFLLLPGAVGIVWLVIHPGIMSYIGREFTLGQRVMTEFRVVWLYIFMTLLPRINVLSLYHDDIPISHGFLHPATTLFSCLGLVALIMVGVALRRRRPLVALGIAWFFVGQLMESTIIPLQIAFEHRNYLADMGLLLAAMSLIFPLYENAPSRKIRYAFCGLMVVAFAGVTLQRAWSWRGPMSLALTEAYYHPRSPDATYQLGQLYANLIIVEHKKDILPKARDALLQSLALPNSSVIPGTALVMTESQIGHPITPGLFERMEKILRTEHIGPPDTAGLSSLVDCYTHGHCIVSPKKLEGLFDAAFRNPYLPDMPGKAADLHVIYGNLLAGEQPRRLADARKQMLAAAALVPAESQYRINVVIIDLAMEDAALAQQDLAAVRQLNKFGLLDSQIRDLETRLAALKTDQHKNKPAPQARGRAHNED